MRVAALLKRALFAALWFMFLTLPFLAVKFNPGQPAVVWRGRNLLLVGVAAFIVFGAGGLLSRRWRRRREAGFVQASGPSLAAHPLACRVALIVLSLSALIFPLVFSSYQVTIMTTALIYVVLGLGLNIVVGLAGLLDLGYVAFYAVGAYSYALLHRHFGLGFWAALPVGAGLAALFGVLLGFPVLRLRGDYLAIVTLGFGEIIRLVLENWNDFSNGPSGIANIPKPGLFGLHLSLADEQRYLYYLVLVLALVTVLVVNRLRDSRIGRAWVALREDELACQVMGIDKTRTKLSAFALGATWAGMAGVLFAAKTSFINPASFTFLESAVILAIVVLGGLGSTVGVIIGALVFSLLPEYLRAFASYRMLIFGAVMVGVMVFRPQGIMGVRRRSYRGVAGGGDE